MTALCPLSCHLSSRQSVWTPVCDPTCNARFTPVQLPLSPNASKVVHVHFTHSSLRDYFRWRCFSTAHFRLFVVRRCEYISFWGSSGFLESFSMHLYCACYIWVFLLLIAYVLARESQNAISRSSPSSPPSRTSRPATTHFPQSRHGLQRVWQYSHRMAGLQAKSADMRSGLPA